jgi:inner membrane protein
MDSVTHTLFGLTTYAAINKNQRENQKEIPLETKKALFVAAVLGSQIPDIDVLLKLTEKGTIMYQMWHRGLSHSILMAPVWSLLIYVLCYLIWRKKGKGLFFLALLNNFIHIGFDSLNAWGTGLLEPFSSFRVTLGVIPILDLVIWAIILVGFLLVKLKKLLPSYKAWRMVWLVILLHVTFQGVQGYLIYQDAKPHYEKLEMSSSFFPGHFSVIGKNSDVVEIYGKSIWNERKIKEILYSNEEVDLHPLFAGNPRAEVLMQWSPFVVVVEDEQRLGIYDPRFYRNGGSFLAEFINKTP